MNSFLLAALVLGLTQAISIKWTGYANNNQWTTSTNWYPDSVPGPNDDVTIESGIVLVTVATGVNSLTMGTTFNQPANLTLFQDFFVGNGGMYVEENGNLFINAGQAAITGVINIDGNFYFESGVVSGQITVSKKGAAYLNAAGAKIFSGCNFVVQGPTLVSDVLMLNQSSVVTLSGATTATGTFSVQATDSTSVLFDVSSGSFEYAGPGTFSVQAPTNFGTLTIAGNLTLYNTVQFAKSVVIPANLAISTVGTAVVSLTNGVTGAGMINAAGSSIALGGLDVTGYVNVVGGNVTISSTSTVGTLTLAGGILAINGATTATQLNLLSGILSGTAQLSATNFYLKGRGTVLDASVVITSKGYVGGNSALLSFGKKGQLSVGSGAVLSVMNFVINGAVGAPGFTSTGTTKVSATFQTQNINIGGTGVYNVTGTLKISSASVTASTVNLSGMGAFKGTNSMLNVNAVAAAGSVQGSIGVYNFQCPQQCNQVTTASTPTSAFSFTASSSQ